MNDRWYLVLHRANGKVEKTGYVGFSECEMKAKVESVRVSPIPVRSRAFDDVISVEYVPM